jgi:ketosteroid isomerase-like protein
LGQTAARSRWWISGNAKEAEMSKEAVDKGHDKWLDAMRTNDAEALGRLVTEEARLMPPHQQSVVGRQSVIDWFAGVVKQARTTAVAVTQREVIVAGDLAIEQGMFRWKMTPTVGGSLIEDEGSFLAIWKQQPDGSWKLAQNIWNSTLPVPAIT